jgi:hypothetical protein
MNTIISGENPATSRVPSMRNRQSATKLSAAPSRSRRTPIGGSPSQRELA